mmetsp:Transcript_26058/g.38529  ORF Transcript_26058/g.38529 Transcript_26058/m.38529 type:complete len:366 (+) Transcript_26058:46-1143(+)
MHKTNMTTAIRHSALIFDRIQQTGQQTKDSTSESSCEEINCSTNSSKAALHKKMKEDELTEHHDRSEPRKCFILKAIPQNRPMFLKRQIYMRNRRFRAPRANERNHVDLSHDAQRFCQPPLLSRVREPSFFPSIYLRGNSEGGVSIEALILEVETILSTLVKQKESKQGLRRIEREHEKKQKDERKTLLPASDESFEEPIKRDKPVRNHYSRRVTPKRENKIEERDERAHNTYFQSVYGQRNSSDTARKKIIRAQERDSLSFRRNGLLKVTQKSFTVHELLKAEIDEINCSDQFNFQQGDVTFHQSEPVNFREELHPFIDAVDTVGSRSASFIHSVESQSFSSSFRVDSSSRDQLFRAAASDNKI